MTPLHRREDCAECDCTHSSHEVARTPSTAAGRAMYAKWGHHNFVDEWNATILAIEDEARAPLDVDDLESIALALGAFPTWFDRTADKVEAMRLALTGQTPRLVGVEAEIERLREATKAMADHMDGKHDNDPSGCLVRDHLPTLRAALEEPTP